MLNLEPLIARLVEDVLCSIRTVPLAELISPSGRASPSKSTAARRVPIRPDGRRDRDPEVGRRHVKRPLHTTESQSRSALNRADAVGALHEPSTGADITDPARLLAMTRQLHLPPHPEEAPATAGGGAPTVPEEEPPSSTVRPVLGSVVRLRPGESLASTSGAGIVIRRPKRA